MLNSQIKSLFSCLKNDLIEENHILNVDKNVLLNLIIKIMLINQILNFLSIQQHQLMSSCEKDRMNTFCKHACSFVYSSSFWSSLYSSLKNIFNYLSEYWISYNLLICVSSFSALAWKFNSEISTNYLKKLCEASSQHFFIWNLQTVL